MTQYISEETAWRFIEDRLKIDEPKALLQRNKLQFLNAVAHGVYHSVLFHNTAHISLPEEERTCPTIEQNIEWVLSGFGGICWTINSGMICVFRAIGLDVLPIALSVRPHSKNHLSMVVRNVVNEGDKYFIDFGMGEPSLRAVCLDFDGETEVWNESFRSFKLVRNGDVYTHMARSRVPRKEKAGGNPWKLQYDFDLELEDLDVMAEKISRSFYTNAKHSFTMGCRVVLFKEQKLVALKCSTLLVENDAYKLEAKELNSDEEICEAFKRHFPVVPVDMVQRALDNCNTRVEKYGTHTSVPLKEKEKIHIMQ